MSIKITNVNSNNLINSYNSEKKEIEKKQSRVNSIAKENMYDINQKKVYNDTIEFNVEKQKIIEDSIKKHIKELKAILDKDYDFSIDKETNKLIVKVYEKDSGKEIKQIPSEDFLKLAQNIEQMLKEDI